MLTNPGGEHQAVFYIYIYGQRASVLLCVCGQIAHLHSATGAHLCHSLALDQLTGSAPTPYFPRNFKPREKDRNASPPFSLSLRMMKTCPICQRITNT